MGGMSVSRGHMYGAIIEGVLYGFNAAVFIGYLFVCYSKGCLKHKIAKYSVHLMFTLSTAHVVLVIRSLEEVFFLQPGPSDIYFENRTLTLCLVNKSLSGATLVTGDALLIYRVWVVYGRNWKVVAFPVLTLLGTLTCRIVTIWQFSRLEPGHTVFPKVISVTTPAMFILPFVTSVAITTLIVVRIKRAKTDVAELSAGGVGTQTVDAICGDVVWGIIESGAIYPALSLLATVLYLLKVNEFTLITGSLVQVVAMVPALIWLQILLGHSRYEAAAQAAGLPAETIMVICTSPRDTELRTRRTQIWRVGNVNGVEGVMAHELEEGATWSRSW